eukprot:TRINITY_DN27748_c0_g1_i1.p1 TRINITY_DN27748_c0_g1~~TRINITY_DN27748_c0_g1_i1.p1  ORF type:complete len:109 (+),score=23.31 TRINITY_DN27748_c0_g1_i1:128-454(+)
MLIEKFEDFYAAAETLFKESPMRTRLVQRYRPEDERVYVKVTDDTTTLQWRAEYESDLALIARVNNLMFDANIVASHLQAVESEEKKKDEKKKTERKERDLSKRQRKK